MSGPLGMRSARLGAALVALPLSGSLALGADTPRPCTIAGASRIPDKLEAFVQSGVGLPPPCIGNKCCIGMKFHEIAVVNRLEPISIWTRAVFFDRLDTGIPDKQIRVSIVDANGLEVGRSGSEYTIGNGDIVTDKNGFGYLPVVLRFSATAPIANIYALRFGYADRGPISYSYGPYFYVKDVAESPSSLRDKLFLRGFTAIRGI
ncbi:hypothetical protein ACXIUS_09195 [Bosea thiooxidans]|nr:hypothetical protein [Bosea sp. (in: a-proteobacteria)]